jgi:hypothetical protein
MENLLSLGLNTQHRLGALHLGATIEENILVQKIIEIPDVIKDYLTRRILVLECCISSDKLNHYSYLGSQKSLAL